VALAVAARFIVDLRIGPRTLELARELLAGVAACCRHGQRLLIEADEHRPYPQAILDLFGLTRFRRRRHGRGRRKYPDLKPSPGLLVGLVHKVRDAAGRLLRVKPRRLCGRKRDILRCLKRLKLGCQINTAHVERLNGTLRTQQTRLARRTRNLSREPQPLCDSLRLWRDLYHWTCPHAAFRGASPAMALGLTDHLWSVLDYVRYPVHVGDWQRAWWDERHKQLLTTGLNGHKPRETLPMS
jgi:hypothetical protein